MCSLDVEPCSAWREAPRIARRHHGCDGCGADILVSHPYLYVSWVFEGSGGNESLCFCCWWEWERFGSHHGTKPMPSDFWGSLQDCITNLDDVSEEAIPGWRPALAALKRRWRTSATGRQDLARKWLANALLRGLRLTQRVVLQRGT